MTAAQLATLKCLPDQFLTVWGKLGGKYASYTEADLHRIAFEKGQTRALRERFEDYESLEAYKAIGFFFKLLSNYKIQWNNHWRAEKAAREQSLLDDIAIIEKCSTFEQVKEWMSIHDNYRKPIERWEFVKTLNGIGYWRLREKPVSLLTEREALLEFEGYRFADAGHEFNRMYEPVIENGWKDTLFKRRFTLGPAIDSDAQEVPR